MEELQSITHAMLTSLHATMSFHSPSNKDCQNHFVARKISVKAGAVSASLHVNIIQCVPIPAAARGGLLGREECVWGPSYWCSHVSHARQCGATRHCMDTVWKYQILDKPTQDLTEVTYNLVPRDFILLKTIINNTFLYSSASFNKPLKV